MGAVEHQQAAAAYHRLIVAGPMEAEHWVNYGVRRHLGGDRLGAIAAFRRALALAPERREALNNLIAVGGAGERTLACRLWLLRLDPTDVGAVRRAAAALRSAGQGDRALDVLHLALVLEPSAADVWSDAGNLLAAAETYGDATLRHERAVRISPDLGDVWLNLGGVLDLAGRKAAAAKAYRLGVSRAPFHAELWRRLGEGLRAAGRFEDARVAYRNAVCAAPDMADAFASLTDVFAQRGRYVQAEQAGRWALRLDPNHIRGLNNLAVAYLGRRQFDAAEPLLRRVCGLGPMRAETLTNYGSVLKSQGAMDRAWDALAAAVCVDPALPQAYNNLGNVQREYGLAAAAGRQYRRAIVIKPDYFPGFRNFLPTLLYSPDWTVEQKFDFHREFERRMARPIYAKTAGATLNDPRPDRRLRIGYLSSDLRGHVVARNMLPIFEHFDRTRFEVFCFADVAEPDFHTSKFQEHSDGWIDIVGLSDQEIAAEIQRRQVDILVILAGHFDGNRLLVAAYKPAPIIISYHDPVTSGLDAIDYLIGDPVLTPRGGREGFAERVIRLPSYYLAHPLHAAPPTTPPPCLTEGRITFGCFNVPSKISDPVIELWARTLLSVEGATLLLKYRNFYDAPRLRDGVLRRFQECGCPPDRIAFRAAVEDSERHLAGYQNVDIALDPFPFCGSTTTYEALWMGVPVVTLPGETMVGRWSASMLKALGKDAWIAGSSDEYIAIASRLAADYQGLAALRRQLRGEVASSSLCDGSGKARGLARLFRAVWRRHVAREASSFREPR